MDKEKFTNELAKLHNVNKDSTVRKSRASISAITFEYLAEAIFEKETVESISQHLGISVKTTRKLLYDTFPNIERGKAGTRWRVELLLLLEHRRCIECKTEKHLDDFYNAVGVKAGKSYFCKECAKKSNQDQRILRPEIIKASNRRRKALINGSYTTNANQQIIKLIYRDCPEGYHVDHIIPISKNGLHHENNLCYLPALLNMQKQAKLPEEVPEIMASAIYPDLEKYEFIYT